MNRNVAIGIGLLILVLVGASYFLLRAPDGSPESGAQKRSIFEMLSGSGGGSVTSELLSGSSMDFGGFLKKLASGDANFVWEVWALRARCEESTTPEQCDERIIADIEKNPASAERERLVDLFRKYFRYEAKLRELNTSAARNFEERYAAIKNQRRSVFGAEDSRLVFGMEEAQIDFAELAAREREASRALTGDERVRRFDELKRKTLGPYYKAVVGREDRYSNYQTELDLRETDLKNLSESERAGRLAGLQEKYFGKDAARAIAKAQADEDAEKKRLASYEEKAQEFLRKNASLPDAQKQARLRELRVELLGPEEAAAYERRKQFEEAVGKIK